MKITIPDGQIALPAFAGGKVLNPLYRNRDVEYNYRLFDLDHRPMGERLLGVEGGQLEWSSESAIQGGGRLTVLNLPDMDIDWLKVRARVWLRIQGLEPHALGTFIPSAPLETWSNGGRTWEIELLDRTSVLAQDHVEQTYALGPNQIVTNVVRQLIQSTGERPGAIDSSTQTVGNKMVWEAGTSKLTIVNDLLEATGFYPLHTDGLGSFVVREWVRPRQRPVRYEVLDNSDSIYTPQFEIENDIYSIPNKVIAIGRGTGDEEAPVAVATNTSPSSPYGYPNRGRWITHVEQGVDAANQNQLDRYAERRLDELTSPNTTLRIDHAPMPNWDVNSVILWRNQDAGIRRKFGIVRTSIQLDPTSLAKTTLREVSSL